MATFPGFGRTFDFALRAAENAQPMLLPILRDARLFCFPHEPTEVLPQTNEDFQPDFWLENFALPYPVTAIEDPDGLVVLWDADILDESGVLDVDLKTGTSVRAHGITGTIPRKVDPADPDWLMKQLMMRGMGSAPPLIHPMYASSYPRRGLDKWRFFCAIRGSWSWPKGSEPEVWADWFEPILGQDSIQVVIGVVRIEGHVPKADPTQRGKWKVKCSPFLSWCLTRTKQVFGPSLEHAWTQHDLDRHKRMLADCKMEILHEAQTALEEVMWFSNPDRFVLEQRNEPDKGRSKKYGKTKRSKERPVYHSVTPLDIRRIRDGSSGDGGTGTAKRGHHRRGHYRTLRADRYARSGMQGKTILVRPCFVGDETFTVDRKHYTVLLGENEVLVGEQPRLAS